MTTKHYYVIYTLSALLLIYIWTTPRPYNVLQTTKNVREYSIPHDGREQIYDEKITEDHWGWILLERSDKIISLGVGLVNVFFIVKQKRKNNLKKRQKKSM
jgi:hypothetical protein